MSIRTERTMLDTLYKTDNTVCFVQSVQHCMPEEGPMEPKCCMKLWSCVHSKIDSTIPSQILSYNITAQSLGERSVVQDSDYIPQTKETTKHVFCTRRALCLTAVMTDPEGHLFGGSE